ncbi:hypothetical protein [Streptomyces sp. NPDC059593]
MPAPSCPATATWTAVPDPDGAPIAVVHSIRDAIDARITTLLDALPST